MTPSRWGLRIALTSAVLAQDLVAKAADPSPSPDAAQACVKASEDGQSQRDEGKYRAARKSFLECSREACPAVVVKICSGWLRQMDDAVPSIVPGARDEQGRDLADVTVTLDGEPIASRLDGRPIDVDPGEHVVRFEREHGSPVEQKLIVRAGEKSRVVTVTLPSDAAGEATRPDVAQQAPEPEPLMSTRHVTAGALLLGAAGAAGTGLYFLLASNRDAGNAAAMRSGLPADACAGVTSASCQSLGDTVHAQHTEATAATALFVGAGVLAAGSVVSWLLVPTSSAAPAQTTASFAPVPGGVVLSISGRFAGSW
jgi:hypothetical protein